MQYRIKVEILWPGVWTCAVWPSAPLRDSQPMASEFENTPALVGNLLPHSLPLILLPDL